MFIITLSIIVLGNCPLEFVKVVISPFNTTHIYIDCELSINVSFRCYVTGGSSSPHAVGPQRKPSDVTKYRCVCDYHCRQNLQGVDIVSHVEMFDPTTGKAMYTDTKLPHCMHKKQEFGLIMVCAEANLSTFV